LTGYRSKFIRALARPYFKKKEKEAKISAEVVEGDKME
jgi:hypothetical protein